MAEDESDQESERLGEELKAINEPHLPAGLSPALSSQYYCYRFCQVVEDYAGRWQVPLPQLQVLQTALCCFTSACVPFPDECEHVQYVLSSLALSFFELLLFFGKDEFYEDPLKDILGSIQDCQNRLSRYRNVNLELVTRITRDGGPWEDPVLQAVLKGRPASQELEDHLFQEHLLRTDCKNGIEIICNIAKEGKIAVALNLCELFLIPQLKKGDMYCIWELIFIWSKLQLRSNPSKQVFVDQCYHLLRIATNLHVIFPFMKVIRDEIGKEGLQICVEICGSALQLDLQDDPKMKCLIYKTIAHFLPNDLEIVRICALSIFFIERTMESYYTIEQLYKCTDEEYNEQISSVQNRVRFELLPILKKGLFFDPEFWNFLMIKQNCLALLRDKAAAELTERPRELSSANTSKTRRVLRGDQSCIPEINNGELGREDTSEAQLENDANCKKNHVVLNSSKTDHNVPKHRCILCNREFVGGHIVRHAQAHQKKGSFSCVMCCRKFRQKGIMLKHLKNHIKKMTLHHLTATSVDKETLIENEMNCSSADVPLQNGDLESTKETEVELVIPSSNQEMQNSELALDVTKNHVSSQDDVVENGGCDNDSNNIPEVEIKEGSPENSLNRELPILHKVNGVICPQNDLDHTSNFKCPADGCIRVFKKIRFLNKHARKAHPSDLNVQEHIMKWNNGKCRFCQRKFLDSHHFIDHLKQHVYPNVYFCLHFNCNQRFKLSTELAEHMKSHTEFKAQCNFAECSKVFDDISLLFDHEAQHYLNKANPSEFSENISSVVLESECGIQEIADNGGEKEAVMDLPIPTWKARKDSLEPKTYIQTEKKVNNLIQNGNENAYGSAVTVVNLIDQKIPEEVEPNLESCKLNDQLVNGHGELEQTTAALDADLERTSANTRTENGSILPVLQNCTDISDNTLVDSQTLSKPNQITENTSYGLILTKPYIRPLPPSYLDERYISMPKRRKTLTDKADAHSEQGKTCSKSERLRCSKCLTTYCSSEALQRHLAQKKCRTLFGFDSDDESA
ncbi:zinc finger protein 654 isoform X2 [Ahaetulla prasina]|uniref:zinc finger protein 654 isoform X2 n=1 Tax=Ahaetulla prasina TaxID=499056 RepID=UPI002648FE8C|nr:zinc finger protein 654 isoform X2 [Ahaetulla prasina]